MAGVDLELLRDHWFNGDEQNLCVDPRLESGVRRVWRNPVTGVLLDTIDSADTAVQTAELIEGAYSLRIAAGDLVTACVLPAAPGDAFSFSADVAYCSATAIIGIQYLDASGEDNGATSLQAFGELGATPFGGAISSAGTDPGGEEIAIATVAPRTVTVSLEAPANSAWVWCYQRVTGDGTAVFDRRILSPTLDAYPFFDGDSGGCVWLDARWWSGSQRLGEPADLQLLNGLMGPIWDNPRAMSRSSPMVVS